MLLLLLACADATGDKGPATSDTPVPTGDSRDDAIPVDDPAGVVAMHDAIDPAGDVDWFAVDLAAGDFLRIQTVSVDGDPTAADFDCDGRYDANPVDTVFLVYDPDGNEVLAVDSWPWMACWGDSLGMVRADVAGTWTIEVLDWNAWDEGGGLFGNPPAGGPAYTYDLYTQVTTAAAAGGTLGAEPVLATSAGDDTWTVTVDTPTWIQLSTYPFTNAPLDGVVVELADAGGDPVARADTQTFWGLRWGRGLLYPALPGTYTLRVTNADWYWLWRDDDADGPFEVEPNDEIASATPLAVDAGEGEYAGDYQQARVAGVVTAGDVDHVSLDVEEGQYLYVTLFATEVGSLLHPSLRVVGVDGTTELAATEETGTSAVDGRRMPDTGTVTIEVASAGGDPGFYLAYVERWDGRRPW